MSKRRAGGPGAMPKRSAGMPDETRGPAPSATTLDNNMLKDVLVIGAGVAGATVATLLARKGLSVVLLERQPLGKTTSPCPDWLTSPGLQLLEEKLKADCPEKLFTPFDGADFHSADLTKTARTSEKKPPAFRVDYSQLVDRLRKQAAGSGVECLFTVSSTRLAAGEEQVEAVFDDREPVAARFVVHADGAESGWAELGSPVSRWIATASAKVRKNAGDGRMHWILGLDRSNSLACWWFTDADFVVRFHAEGTRESVQDACRSLITRAGQAGLLPADLKAGVSAMTVRPAPARGALKIDSHVGKRSLRIGEAGGFVAVASREGIYPAMWSASLAADVLVAAIDSRHPQDELRRFSESWRTTMAEYLRPPNTDAHFLLPLVFSNQQMADRMAGAFWRGENI